jgi:zinc D-Ala-D-Ala dipeptidase
VDLTLYDLKTGTAVKMPSGYDEMSPRAYADFAGGTPDERERRGILRHAMEAEGFTVYPQEWWHFDYKDWKHYPIMNVRFEDLGKPN